MGEELPINPRLLGWFQNRGIGPETLRLTGTYTGLHRQNGVGFKIEPSPEGDVIAFRFIEKGITVNQKFRGAQKKFYQTPGGERVFWNGDVLDDPLLKSGEAPLVITEGEIDAASFIEAGHFQAVSVPDGAPPPKEGRPDELPDPEADTLYSYIHRSWEKLKDIKRIIIAVDADPPGQRLAFELIRRLGAPRCFTVTYPEGCKDANDVLQKFGPEAVLSLLVEAKHVPVAGLFTIKNAPKEPDLRPVTTGWGRLDEYLLLYRPAFMTVTGVANAGKSTWANQLVAQAAVLHKWPVAIASFEMRIRPFITDTLAAVYRNYHPHASQQEIEDWMDEKFAFIAPQVGDEAEAFDIDWLIERAEAAVVRHNVKILLIDPWNEIEHVLGKGETMTDYVGRAIRSLKKFGKEHGVLVIVVAHPTKGSANKNPEEITLYDVADSAHFANKSDIGVVVSRIQGSAETNVHVKKIRYQPTTGKPGMIFLTYDHTNRTFSQ